MGLPAESVRNGTEVSIKPMSSTRKTMMFGGNSSSTGEVHEMKQLSVKRNIRACRRGLKSLLILLMVNLVEVILIFP